MTPDTPSPEPPGGRWSVEEAAALLADRICQRHYVEWVLRKCVAASSPAPSPEPGREPVAWQCRFHPYSGPLYEWTACTPEFYAAPPQGWEVRALVVAHPPAPEPGTSRDALIQRLRERARMEWDDLHKLLTEAADALTQAAPATLEKGSEHSATIDAMTASVDEFLGSPPRPKAVARVTLPFSGECDVFTWEQVQGLILWDRNRLAPEPLRKLVHAVREATMAYANNSYRLGQKNPPTPGCATLSEHDHEEDERSDGLWAAFESALAALGKQAGAQAAQAKPVARIATDGRPILCGRPGREPLPAGTSLYAAPPALEQAARQLLAAWRFQDMSVTMDEAYAALKKALGERE